ncbi:putative phd-finger domain-containing protein [Rosellinia necatrix]|uniref:Putative phd-finger domain-containing protein n=1 Tax=Rosellinia necatrix TaxID=77044 RepID=A0A1W2TEI0_ROSNE|nr:putative phd-finger domain-containing protein [Rosellinia necatrix]
MSSSHSKPTRSRLSSPHRHSSSSAGHTRGGGAGGGPSDGSRSLMQRWLEPPVQNKPSFQEAGLVRGGVVENMAPLGTMPRAAMLKKTPLCAESPPPVPASTVKRIVLKKPFSPVFANAAAAAAATVATTPGAAAVTPDVTRMSLSRTGSAGTVEDVMGDASLSPTSRGHLTLPIPVVDDMDDDDYVPKKSKARRSLQNASHTKPSFTPVNLSHPRRQSHRHKSARSSPIPPPVPEPELEPELVVDPTPDPTPAPTSPPSPSLAHSEALSPRQLAREPDDKEQADKIVEIAVEEALRHNRYPTAWALRLLYDENSHKPKFVSMIEDVYYQRATPKTMRKFHRLISEKKKEGKKENRGCYYFVPPTSGDGPSPRKPVPAPYEHLIRMDFASLIRASASDTEADADSHISKKRKTESVTERATPARQADARVEARPDARADAATAASQAALHSQRNGGHQQGHHGRGGHVKTNKSPRGKKTRSGSVSSSSSLSSVPDDAIEDYDGFMGSVDGDPEASWMEDDHAEGNNAQTPAGSLRPISVKQAKPASKKQIVSPNPAPEQNTPTTHPPRSRDSSMPVAVVATSTTTANNGTPNHASLHTPHHTSHYPKDSAHTLKFPSRFGDLDNAADLFARKKRSRKSETAVNTQSASEDSFVREPLELDELPDEPDLLPQPPAPPPERARLSRTPAPPLSSRAARAAKRNHDEFDDASSPTLSSFRADFELSSARNSRAATPTNPRSSKKPRGGLRVKTSPMKKKGTSAGIPRGSGERPSPVGNGLANNQDDNDDSCYTCGGNGELVCCDGCSFSFHFMCIDPPMDQGHVPDEWYCNECQVRYNPPLVNEHKGIFGALTAALQRKNPRAFRLSEPIREYFEDVRTGAEGEYEEVAPPKPKPNKKSADEAFDFFRLRNGDKAVLCHHCHKGATDSRPIIPCSMCGLNWHLECLDPPLALPPILRTWRCPCHVDDLLSDLPIRLAPAHKYRKIKNMPVIEQGYSRGLANNGWIEIEEDDSDDDEGWKENKAFGRVFRVSSKGIKQDFINRVHQNRGGSKFGPGTVANPASTIALKLPSLEEQQAAQVLLQLAEGQGNGAQPAARATVRQARPPFISVVTQGDDPSFTINDLANADVAVLEAMLTQADALKQKISRILEGRTNHTCHEKSDTELKALTPSSISHDDSTAVDELKLDLSSSHDPEKSRSIEDAEPALDSDMHID